MLIWDFVLIMSSKKRDLYPDRDVCKHTPVYYYVLYYYSNFKLKLEIIGDRRADETPIESYNLIFINLLLLYIGMVFIYFLFLRRPPRNVPIIYAYLPNTVIHPNSIIHAFSINYAETSILIKTWDYILVCVYACLKCICLVHVHV